MLLAVDVGNTNIVMGIYQDRRLLRTWRLHTNAAVTEDEFAVLAAALISRLNVDLNDIKKTVISCVVPPMMRTLEAFCCKYTGGAPAWVNADMVSWMPIRYARPAELGADRIVNAVAAFEKYRTDLIVIDLGTATTFDVVSAKGEYLGGAITPGINTCAEALYSRAPKLPKVDLSHPPRLAIGDNSVHSIQSGILFGYAGLIDGMIDRMSREFGKSLKVVATGGLAGVMSSVSKYIEVIEPDLTLEGLLIISERL
ncbi:MAG: type III pantothenate kinase [Desulfobacterales bacterium]